MVLIFNFSVQNLEAASKVKVMIGSKESLADIQSLAYDIREGENGYLISNGVITENKVRLEVRLTKDQFQRFKYCSVFIQDKSGQSSNKLSSEK
jgi:hypothetical protein